MPWLRMLVATPALLCFHDVRVDNSTLRVDEPVIVTALTGLHELDSTSISLF